jgi:rod shape-determining protein MreD
MSLMRAARPLNPWSWLVAPALICVALTVLFAAPFRLFGLRLPEPVFGLVLAFAWPIIRPSALAPFALLAFGLFTDLYWGSPTGLWGVSLLVAYAGALSIRGLMQGQSWVVTWMWFVAMTAMAMAMAFFLSVLSSLNIPNLFGVFWQFLVTAALYPFADRLIQRFEDADVRFR